MDQGFFRSCPSIAIRTQATAGMSWACLSRTVAWPLTSLAVMRRAHGTTATDLPRHRASARLPGATSHEPRARVPTLGSARADEVSP